MSDRSFLIVAVAAIGGAILGAYLFSRRGVVSARVESFAPALASLGPTFPSANQNVTGGLTNIQTGRQGEICSGIAGGVFDPPGCPGARN